MSQSRKTIQEMLGEMESMQSERETEIVRLRHRQDSLGDRRKDLYEQVAQDSSNTEALNKLAETEDQLEKLQADVNRAEAALKLALFEIRQRIIEMRNEQLSNLEEQARQIREHRKLIHTELLPEAQRRVNALEEDETDLQRQLDEISQQTKTLNAIDLQPTTMA